MKITFIERSHFAANSELVLDTLEDPFIFFFLLGIKWIIFITRANLSDYFLEVITEKGFPNDRPGQSAVWQFGFLVRECATLT
jgi:hypothetical protein